MTTYIVICVMHGNIEQREALNNAAALRIAKDLVRRGGRLVEIYNARDKLVWQSEPGV
jgi:hypothetical protein